MAISYESESNHWNYFLALEEDFGRIARYVEPCSSNEETFSIEFARLLMTATQEVDVILKALCKLLEPNANSTNINDYYSLISPNLPDLLNEPVTIQRYGLQSVPWSNWTSQYPPIWWSANNKIKHERHLHFGKATLKNTYNSLAGLYVVIAYLYRQKMIEEMGPAIRWRDVTRKMKSGLELFQLDTSYYHKNLVV